jgi:pyrophosphatase PpaX
MSAYRTVLFDLDGTLVDSIALILDSYRHTFRAHGLTAQDDAACLAWIGTPLAVHLAPFAKDEADLAALVATYRAYNFANHDARVRPYPGVTELIAALRARGVPLGLVTSKSRAGTMMGLAIAKLEGAFGAVVCSEDVTRPKPHREPVDRALAILGATTESALFVGDGVHDMHAGRSAGVATGAAMWGPFTREALAPAAPTHWLSSPDDVLSLV